MKARFDRFERRGKHLLITLRHGHQPVGLWSHLGMSGKWLRREPGQQPSRFSRVALELYDGVVLHFDDLRLFGKLRVVKDAAFDAQPVIAALGPDPLNDGDRRRPAGGAPGPQQETGQAAAAGPAPGTGHREHPGQRGAVPRGHRPAPPGGDADPRRGGPPGPRHAAVDRLHATQLRERRARARTSSTSRTRPAQTRSRSTTAPARSARDASGARSHGSCRPDDRRFSATAARSSPKEQRARWRVLAGGPSAPPPGACPAGPPASRRRHQPAAPR